MLHLSRSGNLVSEECINLLITCQLADYSIYCLCLTPPL